MIKTKINLSEYQLKKIAAALKNQKAVKLRLSYEQIAQKGKYNILLTNAQKRKTK